LFYVAGGGSRPPLEEVVRVAKKHGVPLLVDAAAQLPPASNLRRFIAAGADLVAFSGGKAIGGPQGSGILCGRRDLVMSAVLQCLDLDIEWEQWSPPPSLIDKGRLPGLPPHGIGRTCKVGKETIAGLLVALRHFVTEDEGARRAVWQDRVDDLAAALKPLRNAVVSVREGGVPKLLLTLRPNSPKTAMQLCIELQNGDPSIHVDPSQVAAGVLGFNPTCLTDADVPRLARRLLQVIG
jgi:L-seryl-tRNA(Ser) seleniumtransferase